MKEYVTVDWIVLGEPDGCFPDRIAVVYVLYDVCELSFIENDLQFFF